MSEQGKGTGAIALGWWSTNIGARESSSARALSARLRRAAPVTVLCEPAVQQLAKNLNYGPAQADRLVRLVSLLVEVREHVGTPLASRLGGIDPILSNLRFQRLMRADGDELTAQLRRAIGMADRRCNVAALANDVIHWGDKTRARWCFQYFGADAPAENSKEIIE